MALGELQFPSLLNNLFVCSLFWSTLRRVWKYNSLKFNKLFESGVYVSYLFCGFSGWFLTGLCLYILIRFKIFLCSEKNHFYLILIKYCQGQGVNSFTFSKEEIPLSKLWTYLVNREKRNLRSTKYLITFEFEIFKKSIV